MIKNYFGNAAFDGAKYAITKVKEIFSKSMHQLKTLP